MFAPVALLLWCGLALSVDPIEDINTPGHEGTSDLDVEELKYDEYGDEIAFEPRYQPMRNFNKNAGHPQNPCHYRFDDRNVFLLKKTPCVYRKPYAPKYANPFLYYPMGPVFSLTKYPTLPPFKPLPTLAPFKFAWPTYKPLPTLAPLNFTWPTYKPLPALAPWKPVTFAPLKQFNWPVAKPLPSYKPFTFGPLKTYQIPTLKPFVTLSPVKVHRNYLPSQPIFASASSRLNHLLVTGLNRTLYLTFPGISRVLNVGNVEKTNNITMFVINNCQETANDVSCKVPSSFETTEPIVNREQTKLKSNLQQAKVTIMTDLETNPLLADVRDQLISRKNGTNLIGFPNLDDWTIEDGNYTEVPSTNSTEVDSYRYIDKVVSLGIGTMKTPVGIALWPLLSGMSPKLI